MKMLELLSPWRFTGGERTRDVWRVAVICLLLPVVAFGLAPAAPAAGPGGGQCVGLSMRCDVCRQPKAIVSLGFLPIVGTSARRHGIAGCPPAGDELLALRRPGSRQEVRWW